MNHVNDDDLDVATMASSMVNRGVRRVHVLAWRDLEDDDAGGSEVHADEFMSRWAAAGLDVVHRTSFALGRPTTGERHGYSVVRRGGRFTVFPRTMAAEIVRTMGRYDAVVEIWNGVPWLSPLWCRRPRVLVLHHIHGPMWDQMFPRPLAAIGRRLEASWAPPLYRRTPTITTSEDTRRELLELGWRPELVHTGPVGVDEYFAPSDSVGKTPEPTVLAVGRQAPVKRFDLLLEQMLVVRRSVPSATLTLVGDGPLNETLRSWVAAHDASDWVTFTGRVSREELRDLYRRSWIVASASLAEGWGLALTEAAGCGTPAVATDIFGHRCSVLDGRTGLLAPVDDLSSSIVRLLTDHELRRSMVESGVRRARELSWDVLAADVLRPVYRQVCQGSNVR
ncbi:MAG: glycosyltransferase family 4 protein [Ilumatobacteraceae bacterium]